MVDFNPLCECQLSLEGKGRVSVVGPLVVMAELNESLCPVNAWKRHLSEGRVPFT